MAGHRHRAVGALLAVAGLLVAVMGLLAAPASAAPKDGNECSAAFQGDAPGSLEVDLDEDGTSVTFTVTWDESDWAAAPDTGDLDKLLLCFAVDGEIVDALTVQEKPIKNSSPYVKTVDFEGYNDEICMAARLSGTPAAGNPSTTKSVPVCFTIGEPPDEPTTQITVSKAVVGAADGDTFAFSVDCAPVQLTAVNTDGSGVTITNGVATFSLANGESETFSGLPEKASCDVTETINGTHTWTTKVNGTASGSRTADDAAATENGTIVAFENTRVHSYACSDATGVTSTEAVLNGSTDNNAVTDVVFLLTGRDPQAGAAAGGGKYTATATGLTKNTTYTYKVEFKASSSVVGTSAECSFKTLDEAAVAPTGAVVAGIQETRATAAAPAAASTVAAAALAVTGVSPLTLAVALALIAIGAVLVFGTRLSTRPAGRHFTED